MIWKKIEKNTLTFALNNFYAKKICPAFVSKHNSNHRMQVIHLEFLNGEEWH